MNAGGASGLRMSFEAAHNNARNCSIVRPASRTIPPIVIPDPLKSTYGIQVIDAGNLGQS